MTRILMLTLLICAYNECFAQPGIDSPLPAKEPGNYQRQQIKRKYGMFIHFGINTFHDTEWSDGSLPAYTYNPDTIDAEQWVRTARNAGMKYVILVAKHHDGFCLWDSRLTDYDVANGGNTINVAEAVAKACHKYNIGLGFYYSLWDRHQNPNTKDSSLDAAYNKYMINQLNELIDIAQKNKTKVVEFWFDGGWEKKNTRWPVQEIYTAIKLREPQCQVGINWSIGMPGDADKHLVLPDKQQQGYPVRYFPSDFRLGDPYLPATPDPKIFTHNGNSYYMPWESTICISKRWFYNTKDTVYIKVEKLAADFAIATAQNNILILNVPPNRKGVIRAHDIELLMNLRNAVNLSHK